MLRTGKGEPHKSQTAQVLQTQALCPTTVAKKEPPATSQNVKLPKDPPS